MAIQKKQPRKILCFGGAHQDIKAKALGPFIPHSSNPVQTSRHWGGVARNIAENLLHLGASVGICSRLGFDPLGDDLLSALKVAGADVSFITRSHEVPTASYTAFLDHHGQLVLAAADMEIYKELTRGVVIDFLDEAQCAAIWVVDTNLPEKTIHFLAAEKPDSVALWAVPTSEAKTDRLKGSLARMDGLILNRGELNALTGLSDVNQGCAQLLALGCQAVLVTDGAQGVYLATGSGFSHHPTSKISKPQDVTGAGDAFAAGVLYGVYSGRTLAESIQFGMAAARLSLQTQEAVNPALSVTLLAKEMVASLE